MTVLGSRHDGKPYDATPIRLIEAASDCKLRAFLSFRRSGEVTCKTISAGFDLWD